MALGVVFLLARPVTTLARRASGGSACVVESPKLATAGGGLALERSRQGLAVGHLETCTRRSAVVLMDGDRLMRAANWLASGLVGFARAWNDTPKIAAPALVAVSGAGGAGLAFLSVTAAMALGGLQSGRRVLATLSARVTMLPAGESLAASAASAALVGLATFHGLPLSTTHVTTGAIVGAGLSRDRRSMRFGVVREIVLAWVVTVPVSALLALVALSLLQ